MQRQRDSRLNRKRISFNNLRFVMNRKPDKGLDSIKEKKGLPTVLYPCRCCLYFSESGEVSIILIAK